MRIRSKAGLVLATVIAALVVTAPGASAAGAEWSVVAADPVKLCREVQVGLDWQTVCVSAGTNKVVATGATVAPFISVTCAGEVTCPPLSASTGTTGFFANPSLPLPELRPGYTIYHPGGTVGTAYANGTARSITIPSFCVGDPYYCPGGGLVVAT